MNWEYALVLGLIIGFLIGAISLRFGSKKLRKQLTLQTELEEKQAELDRYRQELVNHFAHSADLLNNLAQDYRQLYEHMAKSSNSLLPNAAPMTPSFHLSFGEHKTQEKPPVETPRDYSEESSGLLRSQHNK